MLSLSLRVYLCLAIIGLACIAIIALPAHALNPVSARFQQRVDADSDASPSEPLVLTSDPSAEVSTDEDAIMPITSEDEASLMDVNMDDVENVDALELTAVSVCAQRGGTCKATSQGCSGGSFTAGLCPGAANIKCCLVANSACSAKGGSCRHTSVGCSGGSFQAGLCPGDANIKCCLPAASACASRGGTCKQTSSGCSGSFQAGLCPGGATNQCCLPGGGGGGGCGAYKGASTQSIIGNGNKAFAVTKIVRQHLTNPNNYNLSPNDSDNTMTLSTACAFDKMFNAAKAAGVKLTINSGFRTYARQEYFWYCYQTKKCNNGNLAAKPGTSNHGIGLALDIQISNYAWMKAHAHSFGFVRTVPSETWHWEHRPGSPPAPYT